MDNQCEAIDAIIRSFEFFDGARSLLDDVRHGLRIGHQDNVAGIDLGIVTPASLCIWHSRSAYNARSLVTTRP